MEPNRENMEHYEDMLEDLMREMLEIDPNAMLRIERVVYHIRVQHNFGDGTDDDTQAKH